MASKEYQRDYRKQNLNKLRSYDREWKKRQRTLLRLEFIYEYGGRCVDCGETEITFLTLEHLSRDGQEHRKKFGGYTNHMLLDLKRRNWPKDKYSLLCFNCNRKKALN